MDIYDNCADFEIFNKVPYHFLTVQSAKTLNNDEVTFVTDQEH